MNAYRFSDLKLGMTEEFCTAEVRGGGDSCMQYGDRHLRARGVSP